MVIFHKLRYFYCLELFITFGETIQHDNYFLLYNNRNESHVCITYSYVAMFFFLRLMLNRLMESMYMKTNFVEIDFLSSQAGKLIMPCLSQQVCNLSFFKHFLSLFRTNEKKMNSLDYINLL